jgi:hypothetical protein
VRDLQQAGASVAMIGDGVNDAPALSEATVGVSVGSGTQVILHFTLYSHSGHRTGTDVAQECASVVVLGDDLTKVSGVIGVARQVFFDTLLLFRMPRSDARAQCRRIIYFNFAGTMIVDAAGTTRRLLLNVPTARSFRRRRSGRPGLDYSAGGCLAACDLRTILHLQLG